MENFHGNAKKIEKLDTEIAEHKKSVGVTMENFHKWKPGFNLYIQVKVYGVSINA